MSVFQIIALCIVGLLVLISGYNLVRGRSRVAVRLSWLFLWLAAGAAILVPNATTTIAKLLGIERGADLVMYCAVIGGLVGFFMVYLGSRRMNRQLTEIARQVAIQGARTGADDGDERERGDIGQG